jgi:hypothetical protein
VGGFTFLGNVALQQHKEIMNFVTILWAAFIAGSYASWPILGKWSGAPGAWVGTIVVAATIIPVASLSAKSMAQVPIGAKAFFILLVAGIINGIAVYVYGMKSSSKDVPTNSFIMAVSILFFLWVPVIDWLVNRKVLVTRQMIGVMLAIGAIYFLKGK